MNPTELFSSLESRYKLPQGYLGRVYQAESSGGKNLYNEKSGARGPFQFIPSTARGMGLENPNDLAQSAEAAARLADQNRAYLQSKGVENVDGRVLYLAHNQGADGAYRLLTNTDKPATEVVRKDAVLWNSGKEGQPAGQFATTIMSKYGEGEEGKSSEPYSALGESASISEAAADERRSSRKEAYALNTLMKASKELEQKPAPMLPIPRLSYFRGGLVSLVAGNDEGSEENLRPTPILFGGEGAEGIDRSKLEEARRSLAEGRDPNDVYQQTRMPDTTGWYMGPDKKLRFEFSDKDAAVDKKAFDSLKGGSSLSLGDVLKHDDLFKYYPSARDVTVQMLTKEEEEEGLKGSYKQNLLRLSSDPEEAKKTILHEAQHFIQDREKFAPGGTTEVADYAPVNMIFEKIRLSNQEYKLMNKDRENADKNYRELINKGVSSDEALKEYEKKPLSEKFNRETVLPFEEKIRQYERDMREAGPFESYRRLSGETESRNVEKRIPMSLEERAASIPTGTEEYPSNRQFVIPRVEEDLGFAKGGIVSLVDTAEDVRAAGRKSDTVLAHISPEQAYFLKRIGGAGTINPKTGLLEFDDDGGGGSGSDAGSGNDAGTGTGNDAGTGNENGNDAGAGLGGNGSDAGAGNEAGNDNGAAAAAAASETEAEPEVNAEPEAEPEPEVKVDPEVKIEQLIENLNLLSNNPFENVRNEFVAPSPTLEQFFAPPAEPAPVVAPAQTLEEVLGNTRSGQFGISGVIGSPDPQEALGANNLGTFGLNGPVSTQTYDEMIEDFNLLSNAKSETAPVTPDMPFDERMAAFNVPITWQMPVVQEKTPDQKMTAFNARPDVLAATTRATNEPAPTPAANPDYWYSIAAPVISAPQFATPNAPAAQTVAGAAAPSAPTARSEVAPIASSTTYTNTPSLLSDPMGWLSAKAENVMNNPAEYAVNAAMMGVPVVGTINTMSGMLGGPTIGGIMQAGTPAGPESLSATLGADGAAASQKPLATAANATVSQALTPTYGLNVDALYDLDNFLSSPTKSTASTSPRYV